MIKFNFNSKIRQLNFKTDTKILIGLPEKMYLLINVNEETFEIIIEDGVLGKVII